MSSEVAWNNLDIPSSIEQPNDIEVRLNDIEQSYAQFWSGFEEFSSYVSQLDSDHQEQILSVFEDSGNKKSIIKYFRKEWKPFPTSETINFFKQQFFDDYTTEEDQEQTEENQEQTEEIEQWDVENQQKIQKYVKIADRLKAFAKETSIGTFINLVEKLEQWEISADDMDKKLTPELVEDIAKYLIQEEWVESEAYQEFKRTVSSINPSFKNVFANIERRQLNVENYENWKTTKLEDVVSKTSLYNGNIQKDGDFLVSGDIKLDIWEIPPVRYLQSVESDYALKTDMPIWDFSEAVLNYERSMNQIRPEIDANKQKYNTYNGVHEKISALDFQNTDNIDVAYQVILQEVPYISDKSGLKSRLESLSDADPISPEEAEQLKEDVLSSINQLIQEVVVSARELDEKIKKIEWTYDRELKEKQSIYVEKLKEQDEQTRTTLEFLHNTGFDLLPKSFTDQIITELQSNSLTVEWMNLDPQRINLVEGTFGESKAEEDGDMWKRNLIQFMNKMLYGETQPEDTILNEQALLSVNGAQVDPTTFKSLLKETGIMSDVSFNIEVARTNLRSSNLKDSSGSNVVDRNGNVIKTGVYDDEEDGE